MDRKAFVLIVEDADADGDAIADRVSRRAPGSDRLPEHHAVRKIETIRAAGRGQPVLAALRGRRRRAGREEHEKQQGIPEEPQIRES